MKRMYDFACENGHKTERFCDYEEQNFRCECGGLAHRVISAPAFNLEGWSGDFPSSHGRFEHRHTEKLKAEQKANS